MRNLKEKPKEESLTIWEIEHQIKTKAQKSLPKLNEIEAQRLKDNWRWMSQDGKTMILVAPKNQTKKLNDNFKFVKE
jgi:hypothetical protein